MEELIPINIDKVLINSVLGVFVRENVHYYNIIVNDCPPYVVNPKKSDNYIRSCPITRIKDMTKIEWPDHPKDVHGDYMGAIILLESTDEKILLVRNGNLWGLPKGVRNFTSFNMLKNACTDQYLKYKTIPQFQYAEFFNVESGIDNICRETLEETGIHLDPEKIITVDENCAYTKYYYKLDFSTSDYKDILETNGTDHENDELLWVDKPTLNNMLFNHRANKNIKIFNHVTYSYLNNRPPALLASAIVS